MSEIELHRKLLGDSVRNQAIHAALKKLVKKGTTVADIGSGTGFISFLAKQLGAANCDLYEYSDAIELARTLARRNSVKGLRFINSHSSEIDNPPKVDLIVAEIMGNFALEEGIIESLVDARRFLKPGGKVLPTGLRQFVAPVIQPRLQQEIDIWPEVGFDIDLSSAREMSLNNMYVKTVQPEDLPGEASVREWDKIDFDPDTKAPSSSRSATVKWPKPPPEVHGFAMWWEAELAPGVTLSTSPFAAATHWEQVYLPLLEAIRPEGNETLELELRSETADDVRLRWTAKRRDGTSLVEALEHDSFRGRL